MIIDFHTHILPPRIKDDRARYTAIDANFALIYSDPKAAIATTDDLIESMDRAGIDACVIANYGWSTAGLCRETNDYILESADRHPGRLFGFCSVPPGPPEAAAEEAERCARGGAKGIGELRPDIQTPHLDDTGQVRPLVEVLRKYGLLLMTHSSEPVGHVYPGKGTATPAMLYSFITAFPDITLVCAHWGGGLPFYALMPEVSKAMSNVYFDTAASPFLYRPQVYSRVAQLVGAEKVLMGSDYPLLAQSRLVKEINNSDLPQEAKGLVLGGNARRLLGI